MNSPTSKSNPRAHESAASVQSFPLRSQLPGKVGLANQARPGLGARGPEPHEEESPLVEIDVTDVAGVDSVVPRPPDRQHEPAEQDADSLAQQLERETGVSGHSGGA